MITYNLTPWADAPESVGIMEFVENTFKIPWTQVANTPRKEAFLSLMPASYTYDSRLGPKTYQSTPMTEGIRKLMEWLNYEYKTDYNVCFCNYYQDEKDFLGWHADDSPGMNLNHPIAVVSFGAERYIYWKELHQKGKLPDYQKVLLESGSLFIMPAHFQRFFLHKIPKHDRPCGPRVSLTFRNFQP